MKYKERDAEQRITYLQELRNVVKTRGYANLVYVDEAGFAPEAVRLNAWAKRGERVYGEHSSQKRPRMSLIAAHRKKYFIAPMIFMVISNNFYTIIKVPSSSGLTRG